MSDPLRKLNWMMVTIFSAFVVFVVMMFFMRDIEIRNIQTKNDMAVLLAASEDLIVFASVEVRGDDARISAVTGATERAFGWPPDLLIGKPLDVLLAARERGNEQIKLHPSEDRPRLVPSVGVTRDGSREFPIFLARSPLEKREEFARFLVIIFVEPIIRDRLEEL